ncbi:MAG: RNA polymerase sigma factor [Isosphaeraceae bacterium]
MDDPGPVRRMSEELPSTSRSMIDGLRGPDAARWRQMEAIYAPVLARRCRRDVRGEADVEAVVQDTLVTAWGRIESFQLPDPADRRPAFRFWLFAILRNKVLEHRRKLRDAPGGLDADWLAQVAEEDGPGGADYEPSERASDDAWILQKAIEMAAEGVEPRTYAAIRMKLVEGLEYGEIQQRLGMNPGAVRTAVSRFKAKAREILRDRFGERLLDP